ncbi:Uma2 family endonuclease, partial [Methylobacterium nonmethylotrophicum]
MDSRLSPAAFRLFQEGRPDEERWELIDGMPVMMTPPLIDHNRIASNLERLLNDALERHDPDREAVQRPGLELGLSPAVLAGLGFAGAYRPEPDVAVIDYDPVPGRRFVDRAYLLAEVVSGTDVVREEIAQAAWLLGGSDLTMRSAAASRRDSKSL